MDNWQELAEFLIEKRVAPQGITDRRILEAMKAIPRHYFIPPGLQKYSYEDIPLAIGEEQTISQPFIVAKMTELLALKEGDKVLEIGTGSGYQAAILAEMGMQVTTVERIETLALRAREVLRQLSYNILSIIGDGRNGYPDNSPYQGIIVTAGAPKIEEAWLDQLADQGRLVVPLNTEIGICRLCVIQKKMAGEKITYQKTWHDYCRFVPLLPGVKNKTRMQN